MKIEELAEVLKNLTEEKRELKKDIEEIDREYMLILAAIKDHMKEEGVGYLKTSYGSLSLTTAKRVTAVDKGAFIEYVKKTGEWEMVDARPLASAIDDACPPPGVVVTYEDTLLFTASRG
jgi:hypothetical protein